MDGLRQLPDSCGLELIGQEIKASGAFQPFFNKRKQALRTDFLEDGGKDSMTEEAVRVSRGATQPLCNLAPGVAVGKMPDVDFCACRHPFQEFPCGLFGFQDLADPAPGESRLISRKNGRKHLAAGVRRACPADTAIHTGTGGSRAS